MYTEVFRIEEKDINRDYILRCGKILKAGGLVAFPTETVYGLGGDALRGNCARKIYEAKGRPSDNPLIIHIAHMNDLPRITRNIPAVAYRLAKRFWPGPLTMIFPKSSCVPEETTGGLDTVAVRMPGNPIALALIEAAGGYVAAPSANLSGRPSPTRASHVAEDMKGRIDAIIDGGDCVYGLESTIVDLTGDIPRILRPGAVTASMLKEAAGGEVQDENEEVPAEEGPPRAPGMKYRHYAPRGELFIVSGESGEVIRTINTMAEKEACRGRRTGVISAEETRDCYKADLVKSLGLKADERTAARNLYRVLREMDEEGAEVIYAEAFQASEGMGQAIRNRLYKAAGYRIIQGKWEEDSVDSIRE